MGHIDHGKTSLLDKIRHASVAAKESGGITQHISVYQSEGITFIDTPGHAAFLKMRSRGAVAADIAVLVISAQDGVMAQTKECINLIKSTNLPVIIALNKIDLDSANPDMVKGQLVEQELTPEEYGGQIALIPVSAKTGQGIDKLLEAIKVQAEVMELEAQNEADLEAVVIESKVECNRGAVAVVIVRKGKLSLGQMVFVGKEEIKVKMLLDWNKKPIKEALASVPVEILGFATAPEVGTMIRSQPIEDEDEGTQIAGETLDSGKADVQLPIVLRADTQGTLEALQNSFSSEVKVINCGVGAVTDSDVFLASSTGATIYAFNSKVPKTVETLAKNEGVIIFCSKIIYEIIEDIQGRVLRLMEPTIDETVLGEAAVVAEFAINKVRIAGIKCTKGELTKGDFIHLQREGKIIKDTRLEGIHHQKEILEKATVGKEYGVTFRPYIDFRENDVIIAYKK